MEGENAPVDVEIVAESVVKDENVAVKDEIDAESAESKNESDSQLPALSV